MDENRRRHKLVAREVLRVLTEHDLSGIAPSGDEYQNESLQIAGVLLNQGTVERADISRVWRTWFGDDLSGIPERTWTELLRDLNALA